MRIAAVQMRFAPTVEGNVGQIVEFTRLAARRRADVVLFPECAVTGYAYDFGALRPTRIHDALAEIAAAAAKYHINLLVGSPVFRRRKLYNCLVALSIVLIVLGFLPGQLAVAQKPNVLFIAVDDLAPSLACYGGVAFDVEGEGKWADSKDSFQSVEALSEKLRGTSALSIPQCW